ncbi:hypothetical protein KAI87_04000, partial [Myxococcota bacterium]|nr:hypothetical protein [Myxococcota bacterium]
MKLTVNLATITMALSLLALGACSKGDVLSTSDDPTGVDVKNRDVLVTFVPTDHVILALGASTTLTAHAAYTDDGSAASDRSISFIITDIQAPAGDPTPRSRPTVSIAAGITDANGNLQVVVTGGSDRAIATLVARVSAAPNADAFAEAIIEVDGDYLGDLRVVFQYTGPVVLHDIDTKLYRGSLDCQVLLSGATTMEALDQQIAADPSVRVNFTDLGENALYTVIAFAKGPAQNTVASGCLRGAGPIIARMVNTVYLPLILDEPQIVGLYKFGSRLHTNEALPGDMGQVISDLNDLFFDPAGVLANYMVVEIADYFTSDPANPTTPAEARAIIELGWVTWADQATEEAYGTDVEAMMQYIIDDNAPDWLINLTLAGGDLTSLFTNLTVGGDFEIQSVNSDDLSFEGRWDWNDFVYNWRYNSGCDLSDICCARNVITSDVANFNPVGSEFTGTLAPLNTETQIEYNMIVAEHQLELLYGEIVMYLINEVVLPAITGDPTINTLPLAVESMFGCNDEVSPPACGCTRFGVWLEDATGILSESAGTGICTLAIASVSNNITDRIANMGYGGSDDSYFLMGINAVLADADRDLKMDEFAGSNNGDLVIDYDSSAFTGEITGEVARTTCVDDDACHVWEVCNARLDVLDGCSAKQVCNFPAGSRVAGQVCNANNDCLSGT